jgi:hypothetical protein
MNGFEVAVRLIRQSPYEILPSNPEMTCDVDPASVAISRVLCYKVSRVYVGGGLVPNILRPSKIREVLPPMFESFFKTADVDQYADWIVAEVKRSLPPGGAKNVADRAEKLNVSIAKKTGEFTRSTKLNIYKKARLAARVREGMTALGYPEPFVKSFSYDLLARLQAASKQPSR